MTARTVGCSNVVFVTIKVANSLQIWKRTGLFEQKGRRKYKLGRNKRHQENSRLSSRAVTNLCARFAQRTMSSKAHKVFVAVQYIFKGSFRSF
jgi:hypothetical protein